jgi:hypothetical protein
MRLNFLCILYITVSQFSNPVQLLEYLMYLSNIPGLPNPIFLIFQHDYRFCCLFVYIGNLIEICGKDVEFTVAHKYVDDLD